MKKFKWWALGIIFSNLPLVFIMLILIMVSGTSGTSGASGEEGQEMANDYIKVATDLGLEWDILMLAGQCMGKENPLEVALYFCTIQETENQKQTYEYSGLEEILEYAKISSLKTTDVQEFRNIISEVAEKKCDKNKKYEIDLIADTNYNKVLKSMGLNESDIEKIMKLHDERYLAEQLGIDESQYYTAEAAYVVYDGTCIDGLVYDNPNAPLYTGPFADRANRYKSMIRKIARELDVECYIDIYMSMLANECSLDLSSNNPAQVTGFVGSAEMSVRAGLAHLKIDIQNAQKCGVTDIAALIQTYNFGQDYMFTFVSKSTDKKDSMKLREKYRKKWAGYGNIHYADQVLSRVRGQMPKNIGSGSGQKVAKYALNFVGNPYVWGGTSLTNGADCSGFVQSVYKKFGINLPHNAAAQCSSGGKIISSLSKAQPGDLLFYTDKTGRVEHVAIYIGNGEIVHASNKKPYPAGGIKTSKASYRKIHKIIRFVKIEK